MSKSEYLLSAKVAFPASDDVEARQKALYIIKEMSSKEFTFKLQRVLENAPPVKIDLETEKKFKRPSFDSQSFQFSDLFSKKIFDKLKPILQSDLSNDDIKSISNEIVERDFYPCGLDGFQIAKALEADLFVNSDSELVDALDDLFFDFIEVQKELEKKFFKENPPEIKLSVEDVVEFAKGKKTITGIVTNINKDQYKATIFCKELGHVRNGVGTNGIVLNIEDLQPKKGI